MSRLSKLESESSVENCARSKTYPVDCSTESAEIIGEICLQTACHNCNFDGGRIEKLIKELNQN